MSQFIDGPTGNFVAGVAIAQFLRVKLVAGKLAISGAGVTDAGNDLGEITQAAFADGDVRAVRFRNSAGTRKMVAAGPIVQGADVFGAAGGKVDDAASGTAIGIALEAASADGDIIEVMRK